MERESRMNMKDLLDFENKIEYDYDVWISNQWRFQGPRSSCLFYEKRVARGMRRFVIMIMWRRKIGLKSRSRTQIKSFIMLRCLVSRCLPVWRKTSFSWRINVDGRPNRRTKAAFSSFPCTVWTTGLKKSMQNAWELWCCPMRRLTWAPLLHTLFQVITGSLHDTELVWFDYVIDRLKSELERRGGGGGAGTKKAKKRRQRENGENYANTFSFCCHS